MMVYRGPERRKHKVYITKNSEYHIYEDVCVAVKNLRNQRWDMDHQAVGTKLVGLMSFSSEGQREMHSAKLTLPGCHLHFSGDITTSEITKIERPQKETIEQYPGFGII